MTSHNFITVTSVRATNNVTILMSRHGGGGKVEDGVKVIGVANCRV